MNCLSNASFLPCCCVEKAVSSATLHVWYCHQYTAIGKHLTGEMARKPRKDDKHCGRKVHDGITK